MTHQPFDRTPGAAPGAAPGGGAEPLGTELPPIVASFLERLRHVPLGAWAEAGRRLEELDAPDERELALGTVVAPDPVRAHLRQVVNAMPRVAAQTRRRVADLATVSQGFVHPADTARMKKAALAAALALVARPALGEERFARIYEPFATLIPVDSLNVRAHDDVVPEWWPDDGARTPLLPYL